MDGFVVYVLYSEKFNKNYTGFTSNLIASFNSHNLLETKGFTLKFRPWKVIYVEFSILNQIWKEKHLKTGVGREFIQKLISNQ
jgi:putative endonuclease